MTNVVDAQLGKAIGELHLNENELEFTSNSSAKLSISASSIVKHMVAVKGDLFLLKIDLVNSKSHVFTFKSLALRETARDHVTKLLNRKTQEITASDSPVSPKSTKSTSRRSKDLPELTKEQQQALDSDGALNEMYEALVTTRVLTSVEFWDGKELGQGKDAKDRSKRRHVQVTPAFIQKTFKQNPAVLQAYKRQVPAMVTEQQFWAKYLQAQSLEIDAHIVKTESNTTNVIEIDTLDQDPTVDLRKNNEFNDLDTDKNLSARDYKLSKKYAQRQELIKKYNAHAAHLVSQIIEIEDDETPTGGDLMELVIARTMNNSKAAKSKSSSNSSNSDSNVAGLIVSASGEALSKKRSADDDVEAHMLQTRKKFASSTLLGDLAGNGFELDAMVTEVKKEAMDEALTNSPRKRSSALRNASRFNSSSSLIPVPNLRSSQEKSRHGFGSAEQSVAIYNELFVHMRPESSQGSSGSNNLYHIVSELLRHYWSAIRSGDAVKKKRIGGSIEKYALEISAQIETEKSQNKLQSQPHTYCALLSAMKEAMSV